MCCVILLKAENTRGGISKLVYQAVQLAKCCTRYHIDIVDCVITFSGMKDIKKHLKQICEKKCFDFVFVYSPSQIAQNNKEYTDFVSEVRKEYRIDVKNFII